MAALVMPPKDALLRFVVTILLAALVGAAAVAIFAPLIAHADGWTRGDVLARLETATPLARCIVLVETGGTYYPYSVGDHGTSLGPAQLHHPGKLDTFYAQGHVDPYSPAESIDFLEAELAAGHGGAWSAYWRCR